MTSKTLSALEKLDCCKYSKKANQSVPFVAELIRNHEERLCALELMYDENPSLSLSKSRSLNKIPIETPTVETQTIELQTVETQTEDTRPAETQPPQWAVCTSISETAEEYEQVPESVEINTREPEQDQSKLISELLVKLDEVKQEAEIVKDEIEAINYADENDDDATSIASSMFSDVSDICDSLDKDHICNQSFESCARGRALHAKRLKKQQEKEKRRQSKIIKRKKKELLTIEEISLSKRLTSLMSGLSDLTQENLDRKEQTEKELAQLELAYQRLE